MRTLALPGALNGNLLRKKPVAAFLRLNEKLWTALPSGFSKFGPIRAYGDLVHRVARKRLNRTSYFGTFFFRNRPQLDLVRRLAGQMEVPSELKICILACSIGAEVYSVLWTLRSELPNLKVVVTAVDISKEALEFGQSGVYELRGCELTDERIFERLTDREKVGLFHDEGDRLRIRQSFREGITWCVGDASDLNLIQLLGVQDMVFANNFLCHMSPENAESCLRNVARLVEPAGYLIVSGVDLDVRASVMRDLMFEPITDAIEEIHEGDPALTRDWPFRYWGLEPFNPHMPDWQRRYSSVFRRVGA
jgi:chemotaxis methyl-accepting protein methylase